MNDAAIIEHLLVEYVVPDGGSAYSPARRKTTAANSLEKDMVRKAKSKYKLALLGSVSVV